ncbi:hypothetical protein B0H14DRAFT_3884340 [Mycena olivaceomarginata]|nr:hypothetical protein B0H14DRAFT_3884340 [Mycena olivaceomarginata]
MWRHLLYTIRKQELGANAFHTLSLRLTPSGKAQQALQNAEKATELYRELVALAPRHLPTLATSLRNLGSILWDIGSRDKAIAACEEAVGIMRKVSSPETYFLSALAEALEQLTGYLGEKGDVGGASAAAAECAEVRREFAVLPPEPEFLFEKVVDMVGIGGQVGDTHPWPASEERRAPRLHLESSSHSSTPTPGPSTDIDTPVQANPAGDPATAILGGSRTPTIQNPTSTDTTKSILSKPLELDVRLRLRSTLMDVMWWVLLGISFAIAGIAWRRVA